MQRITINSKDNGRVKRLSPVCGAPYGRFNANQWSAGESVATTMNRIEQQRQQQQQQIVLFFKPAA